MEEHDLAAKEKQQPALEHENEKQQEENAGTSASGDSEYRLPEKIPVCIRPLHGIGDPQKHPCTFRSINEVRLNLSGL